MSELLEVIIEKPLVTVVTPCHNGEKYLSGCINSVIQQTYTNWEMFIVDDGSTDSSASIIKSFSNQDHRIRYLKTEKKSGSPAVPRNIGIDAAKGQYLAFLDCDDLWLPTKLERQVSIFENDHPAIVFSNYFKIDEDGKKHDDAIIASHRVEYDLLLRGNYLGNLTCMVDRSIVAEIRQKKIGHEDYNFWLDILKKGFFALNTDTVEALYRISNKSVSAQKSKVYKWYWHIYREEQGLSIPRSLFCLLCSGVKAFNKYIK